jgi:hypothetical protein
VARRQIEQPRVGGRDREGIDDDAVVVDRDGVQARAGQGKDRPRRGVAGILDRGGAPGDAVRVGQQPDRVPGPRGDDHLVRLAGESSRASYVLCDGQAQFIQPRQRQPPGRHRRRRRLPPRPPPGSVDQAGDVRPAGHQIDDRSGSRSRPAAGVGGDRRPGGHGGPRQLSAVDAGRNVGARTVPRLHPALAVELGQRGDDRRPRHAQVVRERT